LGHAPNPENKKPVRGFCSATPRAPDPRPPRRALPRPAKGGAWRPLNRGMYAIAHAPMKSSAVGKTSFLSSAERHFPIERRVLLAVPAYQQRGCQRHIGGSKGTPCVPLTGAAVIRPLYGKKYATDSCVRNCAGPAHNCGTGAQFVPTVWSEEQFTCCLA
jgi:hypothetical protein